jgi:hypothetical protein
MKIKKLSPFLLALQIALLLVGCKQRQSVGARAFNSEVSEACLPEADDPAGCGLSFPYDYDAPEEMFALFHQEGWDAEVEKIKGAKPYVFETAAQFNLKEEEAASIAIYSGEQFSAINSLLRKKEPLEKFKPIVYLAASGMRKLPRFSGVAYRGSHLRPEVLQKYQASLDRKVPVQELGFTSATQLEEVAEAFQQDGRFVIESTTGVAIDGFSQTPYEKEILFAPGSWFQVVDIKEVDDFGIITVVSMKEVMGSVP